MSATSLRPDGTTDDNRWLTCYLVRENDPYEFVPTARLNLPRHRTSMHPRLFRYRRDYGPDSKTANADPSRLKKVWKGMTARLGRDACPMIDQIEQEPQQYSLKLRSLLRATA